MEKDFHYYTIYVLSRYAGFSQRDSYIIAYSSQYVDDSTESKPMNVGNYIFDPIRTAHMGLRSFTWGVQKKIFIPFHFLPPGSLRRTAGRFSYITQPNSILANKLIKEVLKDKSEIRLHRLGIALHTFVDTWSHQKFSGREHKENDIDKIKRKSKYRGLFQTLGDIALSRFPYVNHLQAGKYPDFPYLEWEYKNWKKKTIKRNNSRIFIDCTKTIYQLLVKYPKNSNLKPKPWEMIETRLLSAFKYQNRDCELRCNNMRNIFRDIFGSTGKLIYDKMTWRKEALIAKKNVYYSWDRMLPARIKTLKFIARKNFLNSNWVQFHKAAFIQRMFVLKNLM